MYNAYFNLQEKPFKLVPDPDYLYLSKSHEIALAHLTYAMEQGDGFVVVSGEVGTGKTTLCRLFLERLDDKTESAYIFNPHLESTELLSGICSEFGIHTEAATAKALLDILNDFLILKNKLGRKVILLIDEAQNLTIENLEMIRMLSNLETTRQKLLQIVLVGQPELNDKLDTYELRQLSQRISLGCYLAPLGAQETEKYIHHRLSIAAQQPLELFTPGACWQIHHYANGIPRLINIVADRSLLTAFSLGRKRVTRAIAQTAIKEIAQRGRQVPRTPLWPKLGWAGLAFLFFIVVGFWIGKSHWWQTLFYSDNDQVAAESLSAAPQDTPGDTLEDTPAAGPVDAANDGPDDNPEAGPVGTPVSPLVSEEVQPDGPTQVRFKIPRELLLEADQVISEKGSIDPPKDETDSSGHPKSPASADGERAAANRATNRLDAGPGASETELRERIARLDRLGSRETAVANLLKQWRHPVPPQIQIPNVNNDQRYFELGARQSGLRLYTVINDWALIKRLNMPAIVALKPRASAGSVYLVLIGLQGDRLLLSDGGQSAPIETDLNTLGPFLNGKVFLFWKNIFGFDDVISRGSHETAILALKAILRQIGYGVVDSPQFDQSTRAAVLAFQQRHGITTDGLVGPLTKMLLISDANTYQIPRLSSNMGAGL